MKIHQMGTELFWAGQMDGHDEANGHFYWVVCLYLPQKTQEENRDICTVMRFMIHASQSVLLHLLN